VVRPHQLCKWVPAPASKVAAYPILILLDVRNSYGGTGRLVRAGPARTRPETSNRAAWHGQNHVCAGSRLGFDINMQPK